jgi:L-threonylcarbamoyladenylate synthase
LAEVIDIAGLVGHPRKTKAAIEQVVASLQSGAINVFAIESAYVYACNAFDQDAVQRLHTLRGDDFGTACQVMIGNVQTLEGLAQDVSPEIKKLAKTFWPGLLTLHVQPHRGLNWDLGDGGELGEFAVRIPKSEFFQQVLAQSGPLAVASASLAGRPPVRDIGAIVALYSDIGIYADEGVLRAGKASTVVRQSVIGVESGLEVLREGAITLARLKKVLPAISLATE